MPKNRKPTTPRVKRARVRFRQKIRDYSGDPYDMKATIKDLLTDMRHYCDGRGWNFHELTNSSYQHYLAETTQPDDIELGQRELDEYKAKTALQAARVGLARHLARGERDA